VDAFRVPLLVVVRQPCHVLAWCLR
jgi:hypothetical protein